MPRNPTIEITYCRLCGWGLRAIWSREEKGRLPDIKELKRLVRDHVAPGRSLGHTDRT
jgi:selenoprotein W-related protein